MYVWLVTNPNAKGAMSFKIRYLAALLLILLPVEITRADAGREEAKQWLERMIQAAQSLNYEGTFVYVQGQNLDAMHIVHSGGQHGERQLMSSLNGSVREVLVADNSVTCLLPKQKVAFSASAYKRSPFPISLPRELSKLEESYRFEMLGEDRIAGMETRIIAIQPRDEWRFGYRLWLERQTGLVLRSALLNEKGDMIEQLMFTNVQLKPEIDMTLLTPSTTPAATLPPETKSGDEAVAKSAWSVAKLPAGFTQVMHNRFSAASSSKHPTEHIVFTDSLATISVFLEVLDGTKPLLTGASQIGAMNAFGLVIADHQVVVVGEVPLATVQMIASAIQYAKGSASK